MALNRLGIGNLFTVWELKREGTATSSLTSAEKIACIVSTEKCPVVFIFLLLLFHWFWAIWLPYTLVSFSSYFFVWCSLSLLGLWSYSFYQIWKIFAIISLNIFVPSALQHFGSPVTHILGPSSQCYVSLRSLTCISFWIFLKKNCHVFEFPNHFF